MLIGAAERVTARRFGALRFRGEGTDLTVGLLPTTRWLAASSETVDGIRHMANLPSEEIFGAPDPQRTDGVVRARSRSSSRARSSAASRSSSATGA